ncbi:MAG: hypothetical protein AB1509_15940 [Chloroflexota bacterium]
MKRKFWLFFLLFCLLLTSCENTVTPTENLPIRTLSPQETVTLTPTPTLTDTPFLASAYESTPCFSGTSVEYQWVNTIERGKIVIVLGKSSILGEWLLIRKDDFPDCWVERSKLVLNFDIAILPVISTPLPPTATSTPTNHQVVIPPTKTPKPDTPQNGQSGQAQTAQALTAQAAQAQTAQVLTAQAAQAQTAQVLTAQAAQAQTAQVLTAQAVQTQTAQALTAQAAQAQTAQALTALACTLSAPTLSVNQNGQNVRLSWNSVTGATKYEVHRSVNNGEFNIIGSTPDTSMDDTIPKNTTHVYFVVAINSCGIRKESNKVEITRQ